MAPSIAETNRNLYNFGKISLPVASISGIIVLIVGVCAFLHVGSFVQGDQLKGIIMMSVGASATVVLPIIIGFIIQKRMVANWKRNEFRVNSTEKMGNAEIAKCSEGGVNFEVCVTDKATKDALKERLPFERSFFWCDRMPSNINEVDAVYFSRSGKSEVTCSMTGPAAVQSLTPPVDLKEFLTGKA